MTVADEPEPAHDPDSEGKDFPEPVPEPVVPVEVPEPSIEDTPEKA
jgi:hypothetical protein